MKKLLALLVALVCVFAVAFTACEDIGNNSGNTNNEQNNNDQTDNEQPGDGQGGDEQPGDGENNEDDENEGDGDNNEEDEYEKLPLFTVETYNSAYTAGTFSSADALGKVLVINFWYTTCGVCNDEMPDVEELNETYGDDIVVIAVHKDNGEQSVAQSHINSHGWSGYKTIFAKDYKDGNVDAIAQMCGVAGNDYPVTVVVDRQGYIIYTQMGNFMDWDSETFVTTNMLAPYIEIALAR